jgi:hypothetical protein
MSLLKTVFRKFVLKLEQMLPPRRLIVAKGDSLPSKMPIRAIVLAQEGNDDWCVGMQCPCGCGRTIELLVIDEASPRWDYSIDSNGYPSLHPSVWIKDGCRSHFWLKNGRIRWCI